MRVPLSPVVALLVGLAARVCHANVEKAVFLGPPADAVIAPAAGLFLPKLTHHGVLRTTLNTSFAGDGAEHWVRLDGLEHGRRYEVRVCWPATVRSLAKP